MNWKILGLAGLLTLGAAGCKEEYKIQDPPNMEARCEVGDLTMFIITIPDRIDACNNEGPHRLIEFYSKKGHLINWFLHCVPNEGYFSIRCNNGSRYSVFYNGLEHRLPNNKK